MTVAFVVLAAGRGERLGGQPKQFRQLGPRPLWDWSIQVARELRRSGDVQEILLALPAELEAQELQQIQEAAPDVVVLPGGESRSQSVKLTLERTACQVALLHDGARPFVSLALCRRLLEAFTGDQGVIPLLPQADALKCRVGLGLWKAVDRRDLYITQTPQIFPRRELLELLQASPTLDYKDEAELWLQAQKPLEAVEGARENFKITDQGDWKMAQLLAGPRSLRNGIGYDVHPLVPHRRLVLGGVAIPSPLGLAGHSDADLVSHAAADALLGAAGLPDIGLLYPASDETYRDVRSLELLKDAYRRVKALGWTLHWLDMVVTAQIPRLAPWKDAIQQSLESVLGQGRLNLKFKSGEAVAPIGTAEAIQVWCTATLAESGVL